MKLVIQLTSLFVIIILIYILTYADTQLLRAECFHAVLLF